MMTRNMVKRVEILFPILSPSIKMRITEILDLQLSDTAKGRMQDALGNYYYKETEGDRLNSQELLLESSLMHIEEE